MKKVVLFTNIKGGVGKTSCCALFAQYLCENGYPVKVLDADIQWEVSTVDTTDRQNLQSSIEEAMQFDGVVLFDMPGTLNAANLDLLYKAADLAVVPISYDFDTIDATGIFIKVIKRVKDIQLVFLPNRINTTENRADDMKQREETVKILGRIGRVTPRIKQSVVIKRYSTISALDKYEQTFPLGDFNDLESSVRNITQQSKPQKQQAKPQEQQMPKDADASKRDWMHFTFICSIEIVDKVKAIAHKEGFSIRDVVEKYLKDGIARYEQKHGAVTKQRRDIDEIL